VVRHVANCYTSFNLLTYLLTYFVFVHAAAYRLRGTRQKSGDVSSSAHPRSHVQVRVLQSYYTDRRKTDAETFTR